MSLYVKIGTQALTDAKFFSAGPEAGFVWLRGLLYAKEHLTDGFIPSGALPLVCIGVSDMAAVCARLVGCGLWEECDGGYTVGADRWARHQTTKEEVDSRRLLAAERQRKSRERKLLSEFQANVTQLSHVTRTTTSRDCHSEVTQPEPEPEPEPKELKASLPLASDRPAKKPIRGTRLPEDFAPNDAHAALASELGVDLRDQFARFRDYWLAKPGSQGTKLDWDATLRNWLRQAADRMPRSPTFGKPYAQPHEDPLDRLRRTHGNHAGNAGTRFQTRTERNLDAARQAIAELGGDAADSLGGEPPGDGEPANAETLRSSLVLLPPLRHPASA